MDYFDQLNAVDGGQASSLQSATTIFEEAMRELNCAVESMCTILDILSIMAVIPSCD